MRNGLAKTCYGILNPVATGIRLGLFASMAYLYGKKDNTIAGNLNPCVVPTTIVSSLCHLIEAVKHWKASVVMPLGWPRICLPPSDYMQPDGDRFTTRLL